MGYISSDFCDKSSVNCEQVYNCWFVVHNAPWRIWWGDILGMCLLKHDCFGWWLTGFLCLIITSNVSGDECDVCRRHANSALYCGAFLPLILLYVLVGWCYFEVLIPSTREWYTQCRSLTGILCTLCCVFLTN